MGYIEELRETVGQRPLILVGAAVAIFNEEGELLLQKRHDGQWGVPGGLMELGESAEDTARREVFEETGLEIGTLELITVLSGEEYFVHLANGDQFYPVTVVYKTNDIKGGVLQPDGIESIKAEFFPLDRLPEGLTRIIASLIKQHTFEK
ncbi:DNA mismatch repair protein MutT [Bacillus sp. FJAT-27225]|uniref:NUDIX hydrolase n=1 Tax=Bacillus sp. FJAT-27225 TaxID=1743144 RepID=UPI00080C322D|nr:NUDIX hydrolase [Bacillus sp. FJAT-27225]OCA84203.1 DNA mismatch repair protein MutT [Bacillus sp. FJAT-27225]